MRSKRVWSRSALALAATLRCNEGLRPTPVATSCPAGFVGVCGTITYHGQLPDSLKDSTAAVFLIAYHTFPTAPESLFHFQPTIPTVVPVGGPPYFYTLPLPSGRYEWVLAVWEKKSHESLSPANADSLLREAGFYADGADTTARGSGIVTVTGGATDAIDFVIDFGNMRRICAFFPPCPQ